MLSMVFCYAELAVSSLAVAATIAITVCTVVQHSRDVVQVPDHFDLLTHNFDLIDP